MHGYANVTEDLVVAELKSIGWYEETPLEQFHPNPAEPFDFEVTLSVGKLHGVGSDLFVVTVCNPLALSDDATSATPLPGYGRMIVREFSYAEFCEAVRTYCSQCKGSTWTEVALMVSRIGHWEFDGMQRKSVG